MKANKTNYSVNVLVTPETYTNILMYETDKVVKLRELQNSSIDRIEFYLSELKKLKTELRSSRTIELKNNVKNFNKSLRCERVRLVSINRELKIINGVMKKMNRGLKSKTKKYVMINAE